MPYGLVPSFTAGVAIRNISMDANLWIGHRAAIDVLPDGHMLALLDDDSRARYLFRTAGTDVPEHRRGALIDQPSLDAMAVENAHIPFGTQTIHWWRFEQRPKLVASDDRRTAGVRFEKETVRIRFL